MNHHDTKSPFFHYIVSWRRDWFLYMHVGGKGLSDRKLFQSFFSSGELCSTFLVLTDTSFYNCWSYVILKASSFWIPINSAYNRLSSCATFHSPFLQSSPWWNEPDCLVEKTPPPAVPPATPFSHDTCLISLLKDQNHTRVLLQAAIMVK